MRNDDPEYVRDLERSNCSMEQEIKDLELEIDHKNRLLADMAEQLCPTYMGEPLITGEHHAD